MSAILKPNNQIANAHTQLILVLKLFCQKEMAWNERTDRNLPNQKMSDIRSVWMLFSAILYNSSVLYVMRSRWGRWLTGIKITKIWWNCLASSIFEIKYDLTIILKGLPCIATSWSTMVNCLSFWNCPCMTKIQAFWTIQLGLLFVLRTG